MLRLQSSEPVIVALGDGASVTLEPPSPRIVAAGRQAARRALDADADLPPVIASLAFSEGVLRAAARDWIGIGGPSGKALPFSPETFEAALNDTYFFDALDAGYVVPIIMREQEKNASAASSAGISKRATAGKTTAGSRAATKPKSKMRRKGQPEPAPSPDGPPPPQRAK